MSKSILQALGKIDVALGGQSDDAVNVIDALNQISDSVGALKTSVDDINSMEIKILSDGEYNSETGVPTVENPVKGTFYLTPAKNEEDNNMFNEYYINDDGEWEMFGSASIDVNSLFDLSDRMAKGVGNNGNVVNGSIIEGHIYANTASGNYSHAEGAGAKAFGDYSHAEGNGTTASGQSSHAEGQGTTASGNWSHTEGNTTTASGDYSHAEGAATKASGGYSHAEGIGTTASAYASHAEGSQTIASKNYSHAEGSGTTASGSQSHAEGAATQASGNGSHAEGNSTTASGYSSHAEGYGTIANHNSQHAFGQYNIEDPSTAAATVRGNYVEIVGNGSTPSTRSNARTLDWSGNEVLAGKLTVGTGPTENMDVATKQYVDENSGGLQNLVDGSATGSVRSVGSAVEDSNYTMGQNAVATGLNTKASGIDSHAEGQNTIASGNDSHAEGGGTVASGDQSHAEGNMTIASGDYSHASGYYTVASGKCAHAEGNYVDLSESNLEYFQMKLTGNANTLIYTYDELPYDVEIQANNQYFINNKLVTITELDTENNIIAINETLNTSNWTNQTVTVIAPTIASEQNAHAEGHNTTASGYASHTEGDYTTASGNCSHTEGISTTASGSCSHAEGSDTIASGQSSHAEGGDTTASGKWSHTEGYDTTASGDHSHAEGAWTTASGRYSHVEGAWTTASGQSSHAEGQGTIANHQSQHVFGAYNVEDPSTIQAADRGNYIEIVGNGTSDSFKSNARTLDWSGNESLQGSLTLGLGTADEVTVTAAQLKSLLALLNT